MIFDLSDLVLIMNFVVIIDNCLLYVIFYDLNFVLLVFINFFYVFKQNILVNLIQIVLEVNSYFTLKRMMYRQYIYYLF
jgi:hypothetical protein